MPVLPAPAAPTHHLAGASFTSLATPSRGAMDTSVWRVELLPGTPATPHRLTREEIFLIVSGSAQVRIDGQPAIAATGDVVVVPADLDFEIVADGDTPLHALCCFPVGGQALLADGEPFTPPWAQ